MGTIYLVRHGQASFDSADYDQLSELGQLQAAQLGAWFRARKIHLHGYFSGSMNRHLQTAQAFANTYGVFKEPIQHAGLNEYDHEAILQALIGQYDDSDAFEKQVMQNADPRKAFQQIFEKAIARWVSGEHDTDYPESWRAFKTRVMTGLGSVTAQAMQLRQSSASGSKSSSANRICEPAEYQDVFLRTGLRRGIKLPRCTGQLVPIRGASGHERTLPVVNVLRPPAWSAQCSSQNLYWN